MQKIEVTEFYKDIIERTAYEYLMQVNNVAFLIDLHLKDENDCFLDNELFKVQHDILIKKCLEENEYITAVFNIVTNTKDIITPKFVKMKNYEMYYEV